MKTYWGSEGILNSGIRGKWSASRPGRFTHEEINGGAHWTGGLVGLGVILDAVARTKIIKESETNSSNNNRYHCEFLLAESKLVTV
jgi:hypothetical protein